MPETLDDQRAPAAPDAPAPRTPLRRPVLLVAAAVALAAAAVAAVLVTGADGEGEGTDDPAAQLQPSDESAVVGEPGRRSGDGPTADEVGPDEALAAGRPAAWRELGFFAQPIADDGLGQFSELEDWLGRDVHWFVSFGDGRSTSSFLANLRGKLRDGNLGRFDGDPPFRLVHTMPLAFGERATSGEKARRSIERQWDGLIEGTGDRRALYEEAARLLDQAGYGDAVIRLGHEFDGPVSRWWAGVDVEKFKEAWRVVHGIFREVSPDFTFDYNFMRFNAGDPIIEDAYPGDDYVDIIGMDIYDQGWDGEGGVPGGRRTGWSDPETVWREYHLPNLEVHRALAEEKGKPMSFPEWGLGGGGGAQEGRAGGDDPAFIESMHDWMVELEEDGPGLAYHAYFQGNPPHDGPHELAEFPDAERRFHELFGR